MVVHPAVLTKLPNFDTQVHLGLVDCKSLFVSLCKNDLNRKINLAICNPEFRRQTFVIARVVAVTKTKLLFFVNSHFREGSSYKQTNESLKININRCKVTSEVVCGGNEKGAVLFALLWSLIAACCSCRGSDEVGQKR